jgi:hypothetical protein
VLFGMQVELAFGAITRWCFEGQQEMLRQHFEWVELQTPFRFILVGLMNMIMVCSLATTFFDRHNAVLVYFKNKVFTITDISYCAKEDDGLTEGAYCSCSAGYEIYACFFKFSIVSMQCQFRTIR